MTRACCRNLTLASSLLMQLLILSFAQGQDGIRFNHLTVKEGLSQGTVVCILQDSQGFMWFGTQDGLNRYDGNEIRVFKRNAEDPASLNDNFIVFLAEDTNKTFWVGTLNNPDMLNRFDRTTETFTHVPRESVDLKTAMVGAARMEYVDPAGTRWSGSVGGGVTRTDPRTGESVTYRHDPHNPSSIADDRVYSIVGDRAGYLWIGTHEGLDRFDRRTAVFTHFKHDERNPNSLSDNWVWPILEDRNGVLWAGTFRGGLNRFDQDTQTFTHFRHEEADPRSLAGDRIYSLHQDRSGIIWAGTGDHGVDRFHPDMDAFRQHRHDPGNPASLIDDNILSVAVDREGAAWVGTRSGLERLDRRSSHFTHYRNTPGNPRSLGDNMVQCILEDRSGTMWLGTLSGGLERFDRTTQTFSHYRHDPGNPHSISDNRIYALCEDHEGSLWIGTYGNGLNRLDRKTGSFVRYLHNDSIPASLAGQGVWALLEDREGVLWAGTYLGGLDRFDRSTGFFTHFRHDEKVAGSLSNDIVLCLYEDRAGSLWIGTTGGLNRLDRATGTFQHFREKDGLANDVVFGILEDDRGRLWLSTNKGVSRFDPNHETFQTYDESDGLQGEEFNQGAYAKDPRSGEMYFGGPGGLNVFHPDSVRENAFVPPVVFSSFTRYNSDDAEGKPIPEKGISARSAITLSYKDNVVIFQFAALSYYNSFRNRYAYRLEGYSDNWIQLGTERQATFTNLDGGDYILRVKASNNDGRWNEEGTALRLTVTPPWWKTHPAYAAYAFLLLGSLYGIRRVEINRREQKARVRESDLRARAAEAEKRALEAENERKTKELEDARRLQLSMLPAEIPQFPGFDIAVYMKTATEVGGDYYDFLLAEDGTLNIALGDATGHGMQAGTIVTLMKGLFLSDSSRFDIQSFLSHCSATIKGIKLGRLFMAFSLVRLNGRTVSFSTAGMPPVYLYRSRTGTVEEIFLKGVPLGAMKNFPYGLQNLELEANDSLLFLTDGLPEQKNSAGVMFEYARVQEGLAESATRDPRTIIARLMQAGEAWMAGTQQEDDITLLVIKKNSHADLEVS